MTVVRPVAVPELTTQPGARSVVSGIRACAVVMSDAAEVMHDNAAPEGFEGDPAIIANHAMSTTASDLDAATAALQVGLAALDAFCDRVDTLRVDQEVLVSRRHTLEVAADALARRERATDAMADTGLAGDVERHNLRIETFAGDVQAWNEQVTAAEARLIGALRSADTTTEAVALADRAPDVAALVEQVEDLPADPRAVNTWWLGLSRAEREALKVARPELVGNLDGIPIADRDEANRAELSALHNTLTQRREAGELTTAGDRDLLDKTAEIHRGLAAAESQLDGNQHAVPAYLMIFDPSAAHGDGHAAISFGNPETADHVSVNVPGFDTTMNTFSGVAGDAARVREVADRQNDGTVASIAWLGYDAPDFDASFEGIGDALGVAGEARAAAGAKDLSSFVDGLRDTRHGEPAHLTVIGHSYGSTTTGKAAGADMDADDIVLVGSPGVGDENRTAGDLRGNVYVGSADEDFVTRLGGWRDEGLGVDPASEGFGATRFRVDSQEEFDLTVQGFKDTENHTSYFDDAVIMRAEGRGAADSVSLVDVGKVVAGEGDRVNRVDGRTGVNDAWWVEEGRELVQAGEDKVVDGFVDWAKRRFGSVR